MNLSIWEQLKRKDELARCKDCGKKIWKFWHVMVRGNYPEMDKCGNCFFGRKGNGRNNET